ncbi:MAG: hypothetical protein AABN95_17970 [Acidobacteriota bacterium]
MKYLVIAALLVLLLLLLYSRVHPYIKLLKKILGTVRTMTGSPSNSAGGARGSTAKVESKLVRCVGCGTWVPANRAISPMGSSAYCSRECLEKTPKERKLAG